MRQLYSWLLLFVLPTLLLCSANANRLDGGDSSSASSSSSSNEENDDKLDAIPLSCNPVGTRRFFRPFSLRLPLPAASSRRCFCLPGYYGDRCENYLLCIHGELTRKGCWELDADHPALHRCNKMNGIIPVCECSVGFKGESCGEELDFFVSVDGRRSQNGPSFVSGQHKIAGVDAKTFYGLVLFILAVIFAYNCLAILAKLSNRCHSMRRRNQRAAELVKSRAPRLQEKKFLVQHESLHSAPPAYTHSLNTPPTPPGTPIVARQEIFGEKNLYTHV